MPISRKNSAIAFYLTLRSIYQHGLIQGAKLGYALYSGRGISFRPGGFQLPVLIRGGTTDAMVAATTFVKRR